MARVGIQEIAEICGVSHVTVSRVLSGKADLHKSETVERIQKVAAELGYRPNILAKSMQAGRSHMIGVVLRRAHGSWTTDIQEGIHEPLVAGGYLPITLGVSADVARDMEQLHHMLGRQVEGLVLWHFREDILHEGVKAGLPIVTIDDPLPLTRDFDFVGTDDQEGGRTVARHLIGLGHRRMAMFAYRAFFTMKHRRDAFSHEVRKHAGTTCRNIIVEREDDREVGAAIRKVLSSKSRPSAVFAGSDRLAWAVITEARRMGIGVPGDLSVVGYADLDFASMITPSLTTIRQDPLLIGRHASEMLLDRIEGRETGKEPRHLLLQPELIVRESSGPIA